MEDPPPIVCFMEDPPACPAALHEDPPAILCIADFVFDPPFAVPNLWSITGQVPSDTSPSTADEAADPPFLAKKLVEDSIVFVML
jgi:hypothetical protein